MAELYSDFLFNPFGSSRASSSCSSRFPVPNPDPAVVLDRSSHFLPENGFLPGLLFHRIPNTPACPPWVQRDQQHQQHPRSVFEPCKWGGPRCAGMLRISAVLWAGIRHLGAANTGSFLLFLFSLVRGNPSYFPVSSSLHLSPFEMCFT